MPWQNNAGGPWQGGGGKGPWGQGGGGNRGGGGGQGGGGPQGPNLEDLIRKGQERLRQSLPSGNIGPTGIVIAALAAVVGWFALTGVHQVQEDEQGIVLTFGAYSRTTTPGLQFTLPWPIEEMIKPKVTRSNQLNIGVATPDETGRVPDRLEESLMFTKDESIADVDFAVFWRIADAPAFLFNVADVQGAIKAGAESAMRDAIGQNSLLDAQGERRADIEAEVQRRLQEAMNSYNAGVTIERVQLLKVDPPTEVLEAFRDVQAASNDAERARNEAQAYANRVEPQAKGEMARLVAAAEGYRQQVVAEATGETSRFVAIYNEYVKAPDVTQKRMYLETIQAMLTGMNKIVIEKGTGGDGVVSYLPLDQLRPRQPAPAPEAPAAAGQPRGN
jgi:modulator of FtsH protease HflK